MPRLCVNTKVEFRLKQNNLPPAAEIAITICSSPATSLDLICGFVIAGATLLDFTFSFGVSDAPILTGTPISLADGFVTFLLEVAACFLAFHAFAPDLGCGVTSIGIWKNIIRLTKCGRDKQCPCF
jgi:hypothetical protein